MKLSESLSSLLGRSAKDNKKKQRKQIYYKDQLIHDHGVFYIPMSESSSYRPNVVQDKWKRSSKLKSGKNGDSLWTLSTTIILLILFILLLLIVAGAGTIAGYLINSCKHTISGRTTFQKTAKDSSSKSDDAYSNSLAKPETKIVRLPRSLEPIQYDMHLRLLSSDALEGTLTIIVKCSTATNKIILHSKRLHIVGPVTVHDHNTTSSLSIGYMSLNGEAGLVTITPLSSLSQGHVYSITMQWQRQLCIADNGLHCYTHEATGQLFVMTKLEPIQAREVFPCFDEPAYKAVFNLTMTYKASLFPTVLSNERTIHKTTKEGIVTETFLHTRPMSTYLLAFAAGSLRSFIFRGPLEEALIGRGSICGPAATKLPVCIWYNSATKPPYDNLLLSTSITLFDMAHELFRVAYPLSKLDFVLTDEYPASAMENWGLIMVNPRAIEFDNGSNGNANNKTKLSTKAARLIAHEIVHQWFGNLVTMAWWDDLWLNEGFATYFSYKMIRTAYPAAVEAEILDRKRQFLLRQSLTQWSLPLAMTSETEENLINAFDTINLYFKGHLVVQLMYDILNEETVRNGLIEYLRTFAFDNSNRQDIWKVMSHNMETATKINVRQVLEPWATNKGYPEIYLSRDHQTNEITVSQTTANLRRQQITWDTDAPITEEQFWSVPLLYRFPGSYVNDGTILWMHNRSMVFTDLGIRSHHWISLNPGIQFPYRVNYDIGSWKLLIQQLKSDVTAISSPSRLQLLDDAEYFLSNSEHLPVYIELLSYLSKEPEEHLVEQGIKKLRNLFVLLRTSSALPLLQLYLKPVIHGILVRHSSSPRIQELLCPLLCATRHQRCESARVSLVWKGQVLAAGETTPCAREYLCHRLMHNLPVSGISISKLLDEDQQLWKVGARPKLFAPLVCIRNKSVAETVLQRFTELMLPEDIEPAMTAIAYPDTLEWNPFPGYAFWKFLTSDSSAKNNVSLRNSADLFQLILSQADAQNAKQVLARNYHESIEFVEKRLLWILEISPGLSRWLSDPVPAEL